SQIYSQIYSQIRSQIRSHIDSQVDSQIRSQALNNLHYCNLWSGWYSYISYFKDYLKLPNLIDSFIYDKFLVENYHLAYFHENVCCISDRPLSIIRDEQFNLHNESGPAIEYLDGWQLWYIHGIAVDEQIILRPETQTIEQIDNEENADVRSIR